MTDTIQTAADFAEWSFENRGPERKMCGNGTDEMDQVTVWSKEPMDVPSGIRVVRQYPATGTAPAVRNDDVEGWYKYELELAE